jgi:hypothetical protein
MKNLLIASVALLGLAGAAVAQEAPDFYGQNPYAGTVDGTVKAGPAISGQASATFTSQDGFGGIQNDVRSGR